MSMLDSLCDAMSTAEEPTIVVVRPDGTAAVRPLDGVHPVAMLGVLPPDFGPIEMVAFQTRGRMAALDDEGNPTEDRGEAVVAVAVTLDDCRVRIMHPGGLITEEPPEGVLIPRVRMAMLG